MKTTITALLMLLAVNFGYSQIYFEEDFNGTTIPSGWGINSIFEVGTKHWEFGSGVVPGTDIADFTTNAATFNDPSGANVAYLWHSPVNISNVANDNDYALILTFDYALNTFGSDSQPDKLKVGVRDGNTVNIVWETNTETNPTFKYIDFKGYQNSFNNVDYNNFLFYFIFDDVNGTNGWGAGVDNVTFYTRPHNDSYYTNLYSQYIATSLPYYYEQRADYQVNLTNDPPGLTNAMTMANGLWYKYVADYTGNLTVHANAYNYDCEVAAFEKNGNNFTFIDNVDNGLGGDMETMIIPVVNGKTYYFNVGHWNHGASSSDMHGNQFISLAKTPANDECANAVDFTNDCNNVTFNLDTTGATSLGPVVASGVSNSQDGVWYKFTAPVSGNYNVHVTNAGNYIGDASINVYTGSCGNFTFVGGGILQGLTDNEFPVTAGTTYYINLGTHTNDPIIQSGMVTLNFFYTPPPNDRCVDAQMLTIGTNFDDHDETANLIGAQPTSGITGLTCISNFGFGTGEDIWYKVTMPANQEVIVETAAKVGSSLEDTVLAAYTGTCGSLTEIACNDDGAIGHFTRLVIPEQAAGTTVYIRASEFATTLFDKFLISAYQGAVGIEDHPVTGLKVYPNPVKDVVNISANETITQISVYNKLGQLIINKKVDTQEVMLNMNHLTPGFYILKIEAGDKVSTQKLIKQ